MRRLQVHQDHRIHLYILLYYYQFKAIKNSKNIEMSTHKIRLKY